MHSAIDVSSVHCPGFSRKGPPPTMSVIGSKVPAHLNSFVVPTASATARPMRVPRARERKVVMTPVLHTGCRCESTPAAPHLPEAGGTRESAPASSLLETRRQETDVPNSKPSR